MTNQQPVLDLLDLVVRDMDATLAFYRRLGLEIPDRAVWRTASGAHHVDLDLPNGFALHFDSIALAKSFNRGWPEQAGTGTRTIKGTNDDLRAEYDLSRLKGGVRGKDYREATAGTNLVLVEPDLAEVFPDTESVNRALRLLVDTAEAAAMPSHRRRAPNKRLKRTA
jgi:catechol 2,3-dioxygenase-like lactoylglutathione lyase family enzyme